MVWAKIGVSGHTDLYIVQNSSLTAQWSLDEVLKSVVLQYAGAAEKHFFYMDDSASRYQRNFVNNCFEEVRIDKINWPTNFPKY